MAHRFLGLDTETTGLDFHKGDRLVEIAIVELIDRVATGKVFHTYLNPQRKVDPEALKVHGLTDAFLSSQPLFGDVAAQMMEFIAGDDLIIHNAEFDLTFLNGALALSGHEPMDSDVLDTLEWVKTTEPGKRASLDAMADRHNIDRSDRQKHGALVDAKLLVDVYVAMTRRQAGLDLSGRDTGTVKLLDVDFDSLCTRLVLCAPSAQEMLDHASYLSGLDKDTKGECVWLSRSQPVLVACDETQSSPLLRLPALSP